MLGWIRGTQPAEEFPSNKENEPQTPVAYAVKDDSDDEIESPETPAHAFAFKAIRNVVFGTPHPTKQPKRKVKPRAQAKSTVTKSTSNIFAEYENGAAKPKSSGDLEDSRDLFPVKKDFSDWGSFAEDGAETSKESKDKGVAIFDDNKENKETKGEAKNATGVKDLTTLMKPTQGILLTPGAATARKKAVSFAASTKEGSKPPRIRSGLPHEFPGKFPSPWTPRTGMTPKFRIQKTPPSKKGGTVKLEDEDEEMKAAQKEYEETNGNRNAPLQATEPESQCKTIEVSIEPTSEPVNTMRNTISTMKPTLSITDSSPERDWQDIEQMTASEQKAWRKVERYQNISKAAKDIARKKDAQCSELAEKLREVIHENFKLQDQLDELHKEHKQAASRNTELEARFANLHNRRANAPLDMEVAKLRATIAAQEKKIEGLQQLLNERDEELYNISTYVGENGSTKLEETVTELKKQLRKARNELREMTLVKADSEGQSLRLFHMEEEIERLKRHSTELETDLKRAREDNTQLLSLKARALQENRLKVQVERLEREKLDLMAELRAKLSQETQEKKDLERKYRSEFRELEFKAESAKRESERKIQDHQELLSKIAVMEIQLQRKTIELEDALKSLKEKESAHLASCEFTLQEKQRQTLFELRVAKEEAAELRLLNTQLQCAIDSLKEELESLKSRPPLPSIAVTATSATEIQNDNTNARQQFYSNFKYNDMNMPDIATGLPSSSTSDQKLSFPSNFNSQDSCLASNLNKTHRTETTTPPGSPQNILDLGFPQPVEPTTRTNEQQVDSLISFTPSPKPQPSHGQDGLLPELSPDLGILQFKALEATPSKRAKLELDKTPVFETKYAYNPAKNFSPRASYVPFDLDKSYARKSSFGRRVSAPSAGSFGSRRISGGLGLNAAAGTARSASGSGARRPPMDPARRAAAHARLEEKKRTREMERAAGRAT